MWNLPTLTDLYLTIGNEYNSINKGFHPNGRFSGVEIRNITKHTFQL